MIREWFRLERELANEEPVFTLSGFVAVLLYFVADGCVRR